MNTIDVLNSIKINGNRITEHDYNWYDARYQEQLKKLESEGKIIKGFFNEANMFSKEYDYEHTISGYSVKSPKTINLVELFS